MTKRSESKPSALTRAFIYYTEEILPELLKLPEQRRPAKAVELFNSSHAEQITIEQARYIGKHYYLENGNIYPLTPEIAALL